MSVTPMPSQAAAGRTARPVRPDPRPATPPGQGASADVRRLAAAVLEVLAGARTPAEAAAALGLTLPRYYHVEGQALRGLEAALAGLEPRPAGRPPHRTAPGAEQVQALE